MTIEYRLDSVCTQLLSDYHESNVNDFSIQTEMTVTMTLAPKDHRFVETAVQPTVAGPMLHLFEVDQASLILSRRVRSEHLFSLEDFEYEANQTPWARWVVVALGALTRLDGSRSAMVGTRRWTSESFDPGSMPEGLALAVEQNACLKSAWVRTSGAARLPTTS